MQYPGLRAGWEEWESEEKRIREFWSVRK